MQVNRYLKNIERYIATIAGIYLIYLFTSYSGTGISPDSVMYLSAARNFSAHGNFMAYNNLPISYFPLLYPLVLGTIQFITHVDPLALAPFINVFLFGAVIWLSGYIMQRFILPSLLYRCLILAAIILSPALLLVFTYLWSETLFIVLILLFFIAYRSYIIKHNVNSLIVAATIAALSAVTRYAGITVICTGGLLLLLDRYLPAKKKIIHVIIYGVTSCSFLVLNLIRNACLTHSATGPRYPSTTSLFKNIYYLGTIFCNWLNMQDKYYYMALPIALLVLIGTGTLFLNNILTRKTGSYEHIILTFTIMYAWFMVLSATFSRYQQLDSRLLSPLFIPLLLSCTYWIVKFIKKVRFKAKRIVAYSAFTLVMLLLIYNELYAAKARYYAESGYGIPGYTDDSWNKSDFVNFIKKWSVIHQKNIPLYTNADEAMYFITGMHTITAPDLPFNPNSSFFKVKRYYLIWFKNSDNDEIISLNDIMQREKLVKLYDFKDGAVYEYLSEP